MNRRRHSQRCCPSKRRRPAETFSTDFSAEASELPVVSVDEAEQCGLIARRGGAPGGTGRPRRARCGRRGEVSRPPLPAPTASTVGELGRARRARCWRRGELCVPGPAGTVPVEPCRACCARCRRTWLRPSRRSWRNTGKRGEVGASAAAERPRLAVARPAKRSDAPGDRPNSSHQRSPPGGRSNLGAESIAPDAGRQDVLARPSDLDLDLSSRLLDRRSVQGAVVRTARQLLAA